MSRYGTEAFTHGKTVGISGLWYGRDYGSILMPYALYKAVERMGFEPVLLDKPDSLWDASFNDRHSVARRFMEPRCRVIPASDAKACERVDDACDMFLVGPDVVWDYQICGRCADTHFFLDYASPDKKKVAYGASFGHSWDDAPEDYRIGASAWTSAMDTVFPASEHDAGVISETVGCCESTVCNPILLLDAAEWKRLAAESNKLYDKDFIFADVSIPSERKARVISMLSEARGGNIVTYKNLNIPSERYRSVGLEPSPDEDVVNWLSAFANCSLAIVDSLYGVSMAIALRKPFVALLDNRTPMFHQIVETMERYGCFGSVLPLCCIVDGLEDDIMSRIGSVLSSARNSHDYSTLSANLLQGALESERKYDARDIMLAQLRHENRMLRDDVEFMKKTMSGVVDMLYMHGVRMDVQDEKLGAEGRLKRGWKFLRTNGVGATLRKMFRRDATGDDYEYNNDGKTGTDGVDKAFYK